MNKTAKCHVMLDLETLGTGPNSIILSVGAALFSLDGEVVPLYHRRIDIDSCLKVGLQVDGSTLEWWMKQSELNRSKLFAVPAKTLDTVLREMDDAVCTTITLKSVRRVWSHGSNFDTVLYENACKKVNIPIWWEYRYVRDTRTLFDLANYEYKAIGSHDALEDATNQAKAVCEAYKLLTERRKT
jgi:exodeoxyribonuclease VIII